MPCWFQFYCCRVAAQVTSVGIIHLAVRIGSGEGKVEGTGVNSIAATTTRFRSRHYYYYYYYSSRGK